MATAATQGNIAQYRKLHLSCMGHLGSGLGTSFEVRSGWQGKSEAQNQLGTDVLAPALKGGLW